MSPPNGAPSSEAAAQDGSGSGGKSEQSYVGDSAFGALKQREPNDNVDDPTRRDDENTATDSNGKKADLLEITRDLGQALKNTQVPSKLLLPSLSTGVNRKASSRELNSWVSLSLTLDGRDKITKVFQYSARLLAWWCQSRNYSPEYALRFRALQASVTQSRKAYRLGRSFVEVQKIRKIGAVALLNWYLRRALYGATREEPNPSKSPAWKVLGTALKMLGLFGFWAGDNVSYLTSTGFLDNYSLEKSERLSRRKSLSKRASMAAARSYFAGSIAGLLTNLRAYWTFQQDELRVVQERVGQSSDDSAEQIDARQLLEKAKQKQFDLFVALLKSCCDVLVFSNNPGVDLHLKFRGKKMHEGFHCICGLISASTVLYNNYPDADP